MGTKIVTFRCPSELLDQIDQTAGHFKRTRNSVLLAAVRLFSRQLQEHHGKAMMQPMAESLLTRESMFPHPESKGGRPRKTGEQKKTDTLKQQQGTSKKSSN